MAGEISITAASVAIASGSANKDNNAGATITAGQAVYLDTSSLWQLAQCDNTAAQAGSGLTFGISLHTSASGQPLAVMVGGTITIGATVVAGTPYCFATTLGGICPFASLVSTNYVTFLGYASTTGIIDMSLKKYTGVALA